MFIDHYILKYLVKNTMLGGEICCWLLLFQEFDFEIVVKPSHLNVRPGQLSRIETSEEATNIEEGLPDSRLFEVDMEDKYNAPILQFLATGVAPEYISTSQKKQFVVKASDYQLIAGHLYKMGLDEIL